MSRAVWIRLNDTRIRADHQCGDEQDICGVARAIAALFDVPSLVVEDWDDDEEPGCADMWLDYAIHSPLNRAMGDIPLRSLTSC